MPEVQLEHLSKTFPNGVQAVRELSLTVSGNEFFVLLGPSGCGKTTTLRLIAGLETPTAGRVLIDGKDVTHWPPHRRGVALLFQTPALYPHRNVRENLVFGQGRRYNAGEGIYPRSASGLLQSRVDEAVRLLGLGSLLERRPAELSGGERQRVALGRALIRQPAVFLLDEPLAHVDAPQRRELGRELKALQRWLQATVIHVTHDQAEALALGDRIGILQRGELQQVGAPEEVYREPANRFAASFVGSPPMNLLRGRLVSEEGRTSFLTGGRRLQLPDGMNLEPRAGIELGIRPEDVVPSSNDDAVTMQVEMIEFQGRERWAVLRDGDLELCSKLPTDALAQPGDRMSVSWNWSRVCWFDGETGRRLPAPGSTG